MRIIGLIIVCLITSNMLAQKATLKEEGKSIENIVPEGWDITSAKGDINKDGIKDIVICATPDFAENIIPVHETYSANCNTPLLAVYLGTKDGKYKLFRGPYDNVIESDTEFMVVEKQITISPQGVIKITTSGMMSAGSWAAGNDSESYRYQNGDIYLIGEDHSEWMRNSGEANDISINYLTHKKCEEKYNMFRKGNRRTKKWTKIPATPLRKLGDPRPEN